METEHSKEYYLEKFRKERWQRKELRPVQTAYELLRDAGLTDEQAKQRLRTKFTEQNVAQVHSYEEKREHVQYNEEYFVRTAYNDGFIEGFEQTMHKNLSFAKTPEARLMFLESDYYTLLDLGISPYQTRFLLSAAYTEEELNTLPTESTKF